MSAWVSVNEKLPKYGDDVLFLAEFGGKLMLCYGICVEANLWIDKSSSDRDGDYEDVFTTKYWLPTPEFPSE